LLFEHFVQFSASPNRLLRGMAVRFPAKNGAVEVATPLGIGTNMWKDEAAALPGLIECASVAACTGAVMMDSAEVYQSGASERAVGAAARDASTHGRLVVATKHLPLPWHMNVKAAVSKALAASLENLQMPCVDLYYLHMANTAMRPLEAYADAFADAVDAGLIKAVGVSNFSIEQLRRFHARLSKCGVPLAAHQVEFSLMRRATETTGMLAACQDLGVKLVAWAPLGGGRGRLTSKAFADLEAGKPVPGLTAEAAMLLREVGAIAAAHDTTVEAVAVAWVIKKGAVALVGTRSAEHAAEGVNALSVDLTNADMQRLDAATLEDEGMYASLLSGNAASRFLAKRVLIPLFQDPLPPCKL